MIDLPWLPDEAKIFISEYLSSISVTGIEPTVLEFGCGDITFWLAQFTHNLVAVEHEAERYWRIRNALYEDKSIETKPSIQLRPLPYHDTCTCFEDGKVDLCMVNGRNRTKCTMAAKRIIRPGGWIILNNADRIRYSKIFDFMQDWEVITFGDTCAGFQAP